MNREMGKTLGFMLVALLLMGAAFLRLPDSREAAADFKDQGLAFFPEFKDPFACTDLEVMEFDASTASARQFKVMLKDGKWVIPSHHNYPADAKDRLAKTAAGVMDLTKDTIRSDRVEDHESLGVLDPLDLKASLKGRGKRVTLRDKGEKVLADFIIGNEVRERPGQRYVRDPKSKRTYGVNVKADLSTKFADWIETNLLKLDASHVRSVTFENHKVDPEQGKIIDGETLRIARKDGAGPWALDGGVGEGMELNGEKLTSLTSALADLKIVGVRPKPLGLSRELKVSSSNDVKPLTREDLQSLVSKGFYPTKQGLFSNQGDVKIATDEGAVYTLRFGEVVFSTGEELSAGSKDEGKEASKKKEGGGSGTESRYLMVTVAFDPTLIPEPEKPKPSLDIPDDPFQKNADDPKRVAEEKAAKEKAEREKAEREKTVADAEAKVTLLSERFAGWYYVTPGESFRSIALDRPGLLRKKGEKPAGAEDGMPPGFPGAGGHGGFPGGLPPGFGPG